MNHLVEDKESDSEEERAIGADRDLSYQLIDAIFKGQMSRVDSLLVQGAPADSLNDEIYEQTALHVAAFHGHTSVAELLVKHGATVDRRDRYGWTPVRYAFFYGHEEIVRLLCQLGASLDFASSMSLSALARASQEGNVEMVQRLLAEGADPNEKNSFSESKQTPLFFAAAGKHIKVAEVLVEAGAKINVLDVYKWTPLMVAVRRQSEPIVRLLLDNGADAESLDHEGCSAFHTAVQLNQIDMVKVLLPHCQLDSLTAGDNCYTPLMMAAEYSHLEILRLLLDAGARVNFVTGKKYSNSALAVAVTNGRPLAVRELIAAGSDIHRRDDFGSGIAWAAGYNYPKVVAELILAGADINERNEDGSTALHFAADRNHWQVVNLLLAAGASRYIRDKCDRNASNLALARNCPQLSRIISSFRPTLCQLCMVQIRQLLGRSVFDTVESLCIPTSLKKELCFGRLHCV